MNQSTILQEGSKVSMLGSIWKVELLVSRFIITERGTRHNKENSVCFLMGWKEGDWMETNGNTKI